MSQSNNYVPVQTGFSRVFTIEGRARPDHAPSYDSYLKMGGLSQSFGDITKIEMPDPKKYGAFIEVGQVRGAVERVTTSLMGRYASALKSKLMRLAIAQCSNDLQVHIGMCQDPSEFTAFSKNLILEDVLLTSYSTEDLGALASDEQAKVDETVEVSASRMYEVVPLSYTAKGTDVITKEAIDVIIADALSCGTCGTESDGTKIAFVLTKAANGSPSTPADVVYTLDKGITWRAEDVDTMLAADEPNAIAVIGLYVVVVSNVKKSLHYALKSEFNGVDDPAFTANVAFATGPNDISVAPTGSVAFVVGDGGYIYSVADPTGTATLLDAGVTTTGKLNHVDALSDQYVLVGGNDGMVMYSTDGLSFAKTTKLPVGVGVHINTVKMKSATEFWVGTSNGKVYYTLNAGETWTLKAMPGTSPTAIKDIVFSTNSVGYIAATVSAAGRIYRTYDGGYSWIVSPEVNGNLPACDTVNALAVSSYDANFVLGACLVGTDGMVVVGS